MRRIILSSALALSMLVGCGDGATGVGTNTAALEGRVTDQSGVSGAPDDERPAARGLAGQGTVSGAATVQVVRLGDDGSQQVLATTSLQANGRYAFELPPRDGQLVIETLDARGEVTGRALVGRAPADGQRRKVQPLTSESSLEARVLIELLRQGHAGDVDVALLRSRIDEGVLVALKSQPESTLEVQIKALAAAVWSAQQTQREGWRRAGFDLKAKAASHLDVLTQYDERLHDEPGAEGEAGADLEAQLAAVELGTVELSPELIASTEASASAASRRVFGDASLMASVALQSAWAHSCARREAVVSGAALIAAMTRAQAEAAQIELARAANARLVADVRAAGDASALSSAFDSWRASVRGVAQTGSSSMGLMGLVLQVDTSALAAAVNESHTASLGLDARYDDAVLAAHGLFGLDTTGLAATSANIDAAFRAEVAAAVRASLTGQLTEAKQQAVVSLLVTSEGAWR